MYLSPFIVIPVEYLAGFLDGEGQVSLARIPRRRSNEYCVRVVIYNTDRGILHEIRRTWGGVLTSVGSRSPRWKPSYALIWTNASAFRLLTVVKRHLRVKSKQATALDEFLNHARKCRRRRDRFGRLLPLSIREVKLREAFYTRLKLLNRRGSTMVPWRGEAVARSGAPRNVPVKYLAGFIDAEGCLMIAKVRSPAHLRPRYSARVCIGNTNRAILEDTQQSYGGILANQPARTAGWKDAYQLIWTHRSVERLLRSIQPYLRIKRRHARILLRFIAHKKKTRQGRTGRGFAPLPPGVVAYRENLYGRMRKLNAKGPPLRRGERQLGLSF